MDIVIIGTGNAATILGKKLFDAGHTILQVFGRDLRAASDLAYMLDTESTDYWSIVNTEADIYLVAVSDNAIPEVARHLRVPGKIVAHTAGSIKHELLNQCSEHTGVFYPLQSLHKEVDKLPEISILVDASDDDTRRTLTALAESISSHTAILKDDDRLKLHVAAVVVNNFTNYLYTLAEEYCRKEGLNFSLLMPLIQETAQRIQNFPPSHTQTGPAVRQDTATISKHLHILEKHPELRRIYQLLSESIGHHSFDTISKVTK